MKNLFVILLVCCVLALAAGQPSKLSLAAGQPTTAGIFKGQSTMVKEVAHYREARNTRACGNNPRGCKRLFVCEKGRCVRK